MAKVNYSGYQLIEADSEEANRTENIIKLLNKRRMCPCGYCTDDKCVPEPLMDACLKQDFVINKAIEALEKQIPKKPLCGKCGVLCPSCHRKEYIVRRDALDTHCGFCGQALEWSDDE